jgi:hypothetical protein
LACFRTEQLIHTEPQVFSICASPESRVKDIVKDLNPISTFVRVEFTICTDICEDFEGLDLIEGLKHLISKLHPLMRQKISIAINGDITLNEHLMNLRFDYSTIARCVDKVQAAVFLNLVDNTKTNIVAPFHYRRPPWLLPKLLRLPPNELRLLPEEPREELEVWEGVEVVGRVVVGEERNPLVFNDPEDCCERKLRSPEPEFMSRPPPGREPKVELTFAARGPALNP